VSWALVIWVTALVSASAAQADGGAERRFRQYCAACHGLTGAGDGPNARNLDPPPRDLTDRRYMRRLTDGHLLRVIRDGGEAAGKSRLMPPWGRTLPAEEIAGLVAFVRSLPDRAVPSPPPPGEALAAELNCAGCHEIPGQHQAEVAPDLDRAGMKLRREWVVAFLRRPGKIRPIGFVPLSRSRMPSFELSEREAEAITEFLMALGTDSIPGSTRSAPLADAVRRGEQLFKTRYPCLACHRLQGMGGEVGPDLTEVGARLTEAWLTQWLQGPQRLHPAASMVNLALPESEAEAVARYLLSLKAAVPAGSPARVDRAWLRAEGEMLVRDLGCAGCHRIASVTQGAAEVPKLQGVGDKLRPDWVAGYLRTPIPVRPWLRSRMPAFQLSASEGQVLVEYLQSLRDHRLVPLPKRLMFSGSPSPVLAEAGRRLVSLDYLACVSCHVSGARSPEGPREEWAPDLVLAGRRLQPDWIVRWLQEPQRFQPGTRMPSFFADDRSGPEDVLGGDEGAQILALRDYLVSLGMTGGGQP
jgi:mono/diheme cytochrome c family protein